MGFYTREMFSLSNGAFQDGINIEILGNGYIYQDGTNGYIKTYADADCAMMISDPLTPRELANAPFKGYPSYKIVSLIASGFFHTFTLAQKATQPVPGASSADYGDWRVLCLLTTTAGNYRERWWVWTAGAWSYYNGATGLWNATSTNNVRTGMSLNTAYTLEVKYHNDSHTVSLTNGVQTTTSPVIDWDLTTDLYWYTGFVRTTLDYGDITLIA